MHRNRTGQHSLTTGQRRKKIIIAFSMLVGLLAFFIVQGCAINPVTKYPNLVLTTTEGEREIGAEEAQKVEQTMGLTENPKLTTYVEALGQRLAVHSPRKDVDYHFYLVELVEPNAFALPGGFVYVSRGLLALANSEDELAGVLGHEIGHVAARHSVQRLSAAAPFAIVGGITGAVTGIVSDRLSNVVTGITGFAGGIVLSPYSRSQEREADRVGIEIAAGAGLDPAGLSRFLNTLEREEELQLGGPREASFFDSHPATPERVENTVVHARTVTRAVAPPSATAPSSFLEKLDGLVIGPHPAEGVFVQNLYLQPDLDFALRFPKAWDTQISRQAVLAVDKNQSVFSVLQVAGKGHDPMRGPRALNEKVEGNLLEKVERFKVGALPATRIVLQRRTKQGPMAVELTWIAHKGLIYQIVVGCPLDTYETNMPTFRQIVQSFRPLTSAERTNFEITRLRIARAQGGETLRRLSSRTESVWTVDEAAVVNGLSTKNAILKDGQLVKIAKRERYLPPDQ